MLRIMIHYEGNKTLVEVSVKDLVEALKKYPNMKVMVSRKWVERINTLLRLLNGIPCANIEETFMTK